MNSAFLPLCYSLNLSMFSHVKAMMEESTECEPVPMDSEDELFIMYTSGTTGKPTGVVHTQAGYLLNAAITHKVRTCLYKHVCMSILFHIHVYGLLYSMCLTTKKEIFLLVWLSWVGSWDIPMLYMGPSAMELLLSCLRALQPSLMRVKETIITLHRLSNLSFFHLLCRSLLGDGGTVEGEPVLYNTCCHPQAHEIR